MAILDTTRTTYGTASAVNRFFAALSAIVASAISLNDARVTRNALNRLSDRELEDIGLMRSDIEEIAQSNLIR
ncbi:MAG: DUF1127 domain-containing protein [Roseobacter sp.]